MESTLSPRDIQTRIRRGESVAQVAEAAGVPTEQIEGFAGPVLAERAYMVQQARAAAVRRRHGGGPGLPLGELVDERLAEAGENPDDASWDAWRREDGRWTVVVVPRDALRASFVFDHRSRYVLPGDDGAHDLVGDVTTAPSSEMAIADALQSREPVAPVEHEPVVDEQPAEPTVEDPTEGADAPDDAEVPSARISSLKEARDRRAQEQLSLADVDDELDDDSAEHEAQEHEVEQETRIAVPDAVGPRKKKAERRRVPSWDEIMFGGRDD